MTLYIEKIAGLIALALAFRQRSAWATWGELVSTKEKKIVEKEERKERGKERKRRPRDRAERVGRMHTAGAVLISPLLMCT